jgi:hypothetical protein
MFFATNPVFMMSAYNRSILHEAVFILAEKILPN